MGCGASKEPRSHGHGGQVAPGGRWAEGAGAAETELHSGHHKEKTDSERADANSKRASSTALPDTPSAAPPGGHPDAKENPGARKDDLPLAPLQSALSKFFPMYRAGGSTRVAPSPALPALPGQDGRKGGVRKSISAGIPKQDPESPASRSLEAVQAPGGKLTYEDLIHRNSKRRSTSLPGAALSRLVSSHRSAVRTPMLAPIASLTASMEAESPGGEVVPAPALSPLATTRRATGEGGKVVVSTDSLAVGMVDRERGPAFLNNYAVVKQLGKGANGDVYLCMDMETSQLVAVKWVERRAGGKGRGGGGGSRAPVDKAEVLRREAELLMSLDHESVVRVMEVIDDPLQSVMLVVMELAEGGPLLLKDGDRLTEGTAQYYFLGILDGLTYLHSNGVAHGDIKPDNILLSADGGVKICDFGSALVFRATGDDRLTNPKGTPAFLAPELVFGDGPCSARAGDVWALGCTLFHMLVGRIPFGHRNPTSMADVLDAILDDPLDVPEDAGLSEECRDLLRCMLEKEPTKRITLEGVGEHAWVAEGRRRWAEAGGDASVWVHGSGTLEQSLRDELEAALSEQGLRGVPYRPSQTVVAEGAAGQAVAEMFYIAEGIVEVVKIFTGSSRPRASRTPAMPTSPTPAAPSPLAPLPPLANPLLSPLSSAATADLSTLTAATSLATASSGAGMQVESSKGEDAGVVVGAVAVGQGLSETAVQGVGGGVDASPAYMSRVSADGSMGGATERVGAERGRRWSGAGGGRDAPPKYHPRAERYRSGMGMDFGVGMYALVDDDDSSEAQTPSAAMSKVSSSTDLRVLAAGASTTTTLSQAAATLQKIPSQRRRSLNRVNAPDGPAFVPSMLEAIMETAADDSRPGSTCEALSPRTAPAANSPATPATPNATPGATPATSPAGPGLWRPTDAAAMRNPSSLSARAALPPLSPPQGDRPYTRHPSASSLLKPRDDPASPAPATTNAAQERPPLPSRASSHGNPNPQGPSGIYAQPTHPPSPARGLGDAQMGSLMTRERTPHPPNSSDGEPPGLHAAFAPHPDANSASALVGTDAASPSAPRSPRRPPGVVPRNRSVRMSFSRDVDRASEWAAALQVSRAEGAVRVAMAVSDLCSRVSLEFGDAAVAQMVHAARARLSRVVSQGRSGRMGSDDGAAPLGPPRTLPLPPPHPAPAPTPDKAYQRKSSSLARPPIRAADVDGADGAPESKASEGSRSSGVAEQEQEQEQEQGVGIDGEGEQVNTNAVASQSPPAPLPPAAVAAVALDSSRGATVGAAGSMRVRPPPPLPPLDPTPSSPPSRSPSNSPRISRRVSTEGASTERNDGPSETQGRGTSRATSLASTTASSRSRTVFRMRRQSKDGRQLNMLENLVRSATDEARVIEELLSREGEGEAGDGVVPISRMAAGSIFGEMAVLTGSSRSATVRAVTDACIVRIGAAHLPDLYRRVPRLQACLRTMAARRRAMRRNLEAIEHLSTLGSLVNAQE